MGAEFFRINEENFGEFTEVLEEFGLAGTARAGADSKSDSSGSSVSVSDVGARMKLELPFFIVLRTGGEEVGRTANLADMQELLKEASGRNDAGFGHE